MKHSLRSKLVFFFVAEVLVILALLAWAAIGWTRGVIEEKVSDSTVATLSLMDRNIAAMLDSVHDISLFLISNRNVRAYLKGAGDQSPAVLRLRSDINDDLANLVPARSWILSINFYGDQGLAYESAGPSLALGPGHTVVAGLTEDAGRDSLAGTGQSGEAWTEPVPPASGQLLMSGTYARRYQTLGDRRVISFYRRINDTNNLTRQLGNMRIDLDVAALDEVTRMGAGRDSMVFMTDVQGRILVHPDPVWVGRDISADPRFGPALTGKDAYYRINLKGADTLVTRYRSARGVMISVRPFGELVKDAGRTELLIAGLFLLSALAATLVAWWIARRITTPLMSLAGGMRHVQSGRLGVVVPVSGDDEVGELGRAFNAMSTELQAMVDRVYKTELAKKEAELRALQAQINPHFLYNTLDVIYWAARSENAPRAAEAANALSRLFRLVLNKGEEMTTLEHELDHLEAYMQIQNLRFEVAPVLEIDVEPAALACATPKLLLQPLVENACLHGIADIDGPARISVRGWLAGGDLYLSVADNGLGMDAARQREVLQRDMSGERGFGLWNIAQAIRLRYGPDCGLSITSAPGQGTRVDIRIPAGEATP